VLREGEIQLVGRLIGSTNHAMLARVTRICPPPDPPQTIDAVYKPTAGERPLDDFPDGTLSRREVAAYLVSEATGWGIVPPTVLRDGPFGEGALQAWVDVDEAVDMVGMVFGDDPRLRRIAVFDAAVNNADRKGGHLLPLPDGHVYGVDHGVCFHAEDKLRTLLWGWRGQPLDPRRRHGQSLASVLQACRSPPDVFGSSPGQEPPGRQGGGRDDPAPVLHQLPHARPDRAGPKGARPLRLRR